MKCDLTINPSAGQNNYTLSIFSADPGSPASESTVYHSLAEVEAALTEAGWPEIAEKASKTLGQGREFSHAVDISETAREQLLKS